MIKRSTINKIAKKIKNQYKPEKIILFGSYAWGKPTEDSDIDLLIIKETDKPFHKRWGEVCHIVSEWRKGLAFSPFVLTPKELRKKLDTGDPFFKQILEKGEILHG